jgi:hypothetical protein
MTKRLDRAYHIVHNIPMEKPKEVEQTVEEKPANITREQLNKLLRYQQEMLLSERYSYPNSMDYLARHNRENSKIVWWFIIFAIMVFTLGIYLIITL